MEITPNMSVKTVQKKGTATQISVAEYFDKNGNGILEKEEVDSFEKAKIEKTDKELKITNADGTVDTFENMALEHDEEYYSSGSIPVAVIDTFDVGWHGKHVCNMMKSVNPDIAITKFENSPSRMDNSAQKAFRLFINNHPKFDDFCSKNKLLTAILSKILDSDQIGSIEICLDEVKEQMDKGKEFCAVNLSSGVECSYTELNRLVGKELGVEITPENVADYKTQIKEILATKREETFKTDDGRDISVGQIVDIINKMESLKIPVYVGSGYEHGEIKNQNMTMFALADNSVCVEAGKEQANGEMKTVDYVSSNSLSKDATGKNRIENSIHYSSDVPYNGITGVTTSMSTPIALAKDLKKNS